MSTNMLNVFMAKFGELDSREIFEAGFFSKTFIAHLSNLIIDILDNHFNICKIIVQK